MKCGARISDDGRYRYLLWRSWGTGSKTMTFVMLNPSTADHEVDDPTIRRCIGFAKREECSELVVVNLFAYRATKPSDMADALGAGIDIFGPDQDGWMRAALNQWAGPVVAAWGAHQIANLATPKMPDMPLLCLGTTKSGAPRHPLYVKGDQPLVPWRGPDVEPAA